MDDGDRLRKMIDYGMIVDPIMNRFAGELFIVDDDVYPSESANSCNVKLLDVLISFILSPNLLIVIT